MGKIMEREEKKCMIASFIIIGIMLIFVVIGQFLPKSETELPDEPCRSICERDGMLFLRSYQKNSTDYCRCTSEDIITYEAVI